MAIAMGRASYQGGLHRFTQGHVPSPTRTVAERYAQFFGLPVEAIYSEDAATKAAIDLGIVNTPLAAREPPAIYSERPTAPQELLTQVGMLLATVSQERRQAVAEVMAGWARDGGADHWRQMLLTLLETPTAKSKSAA